jgi:hypothetical protein
MVRARGRFTKPVSYVIDGAYFTANVVLADLRKNGLTDIVTDGYIVRHAATVASGVNAPEQRP